MKKKFIMIFSVILVLFFSIVDVKATNQVIDTGNNIQMPYNLYTDANNSYEITGLSTHSDFYQIVDVSSNTEIVNKIDNIMTMLNQLDVAEKDLTKLTSGTNEYTNKVAEISSIKSAIDGSVTDSNLKTLVADFTEANWVSISNGSSVIPTTNVTEGNYYIVWLKVVSATTTIYEYHPYKAIKTSYYSSNTVTSSNNSTTSTTNPDTGIENTLLYVGVGVALLIGSALVVSKNKEVY